MGVRDCDLHPTDQRIARAQAHSARDALDSRVRLAEPISRHAAVIPRRGKVRIERESTIDEGSAVV
jgi:hypothetical protein